VQAIVLGSAAGGGIPQWNCRCPVCSLVWAGDPRVEPRTQSSLAVSADGESWLLINASPDIRQQIAATPALHPRRGLRDSPVAAVLLTNGDVDHVAGLLTLRESQPFSLFASAEILDALAGNRIFDVVSPSVVPRNELRPDNPTELLPGLAVTLFPVPGKAPLWLEEGEPVIGESTGTTVGAMIEAQGRRIVYIPGCARVDDGVRGRVEGADLLLFDGTVMEDDDMIRAGVGSKTGWRMGHVPMVGPNGSMAGFADVAIAQKIYVHINNTNPALVAGSPERARIEAAGWTLATDGLMVTL
jgi:pyrroloquinoline quinone biosynthesis protein B